MSGKRAVPYKADGALRLFWVSWNQPGEDFRPVYDPKKESEPFGHRYWCSGEGEGYFTMCAMVAAEDEADAKRRVRKYWPEAKVWRFCDEKPAGWDPGDRFPMPKKRS